MHLYAADHVPNIPITLHNATNSIFRAGQAKVGIISSMNHTRTKGTSSVELPDGRFLHIYQQLDELFPDEYTNVHFILDGPSYEMNTGIEVDIILRLFTERGTRDYPIKMVREERKAK